MWSSRNYADFTRAAFFILDHWDMWSSRNVADYRAMARTILDHWDMWSSRNLADRLDPRSADFRSLGYVV